MILLYLDETLTEPYKTASRESGGIGRRAGFRFLCPSGCGGSTPPFRTISLNKRSSPYGRCSGFVLDPVYKCDCGLLAAQQPPFHKVTAELPSYRTETSVCPGVENSPRPSPHGEPTRHPDTVDPLKSGYPWSQRRKGRRLKLGLGRSGPESRQR